MDDKIDDWLKAKFPIYADPNDFSGPKLWEIWGGDVDKEYKQRINGEFETQLTPKEEISLRKKNGLCLECGEKGKFINLALVCSKHGVY